MKTSVASLNIEAKNFLAYLRYERNLSVLTQKNYERQLKALIVLCEPFSINHWQDLTCAQVRSLLVKSHQQGLGAASLALRFSVLRTFLNWLIKQKKIKTNVAKGITLPRVPRRLPKNLDVDEVSQLLNITLSHRLAARDRALMELIYGAGLRVSEVVGVNIADLDFDTGEVWVKGKGSKIRRLPMGRTAIACLEEWLTLRNNSMPKDKNAVFLSQKGERISVRQVQKRLDLWGIKQGMASHVHPHKLRHAFATHMLESSRDLRAVQELLGHANLSTTQIYTHLDFQHLASVYDAAHPRAKRK